ncbi:hypothetical protein JKP88DRAFT_91876 [Tribonema minus]|uniref:Secreted protein n=1 Tax=Tribonema minus TaxID=303371 RepID=A0A835YTX0_9STRA|nr:hypothetical protein JKP88DRAFT_91876 [Tribonema minus]
MMSFRVALLALAVTLVGVHGTCTTKVYQAGGQQVCVDPCSASQVVYDSSGKAICLQYTSTSNSTKKICPQSNIYYTQGGTPVCVLTPKKTALCPPDSIAYSNGTTPVCVMLRSGNGACPSSDIRYSNSVPYCLV